GAEPAPSGIVRTSAVDGSRYPSSPVRCPVYQTPPSAAGATSCGRDPAGTSNHSMTGSIVGTGVGSAVAVGVGAGSRRVGVGVCGVGVGFGCIMVGLAVAASSASVAVVAAAGEVAASVGVAAISVAVGLGSDTASGVAVGSSPSSPLIEQAGRIKREMSR